MALHVRWSSTHRSSGQCEIPDRMPQAELEALFGQWQASDKDGKGALLESLPLPVARELLDWIMAHTQAPQPMPRKARI